MLYNGLSMPVLAHELFGKFAKKLRSCLLLSFTFVVREANCLADTLAKAGMERSLFLAWW
ncbi:hypothetical protein Goari_025300 [Gossypium aridum]|uniref:RNase H type-1 domain-containing protein n=1 Tax=Gossypium aridum TaxID=34290 RepID=A0A7J8X8T7_GOSAI|nr:hypothetical protein [Gossypium aridum]